MKWRATARSSLKTAKWHPLVSFTPLHITQSSWIHGPTHQPVVWRFIAGWLLVHWRWGHLKTTPALVDVWQDSETSHSKSSSGNFQHWYLADMLASVYSYRVMVKSVSSCCVRGSRVLSNPVTIRKLILHICYKNRCSKTRLPCGVAIVCTNPTPFHCTTVYNKTFEGHNFHGFHSSPLNRESFPTNYGIVNQQHKSTSILPQKFSCEWWFSIPNTKFSPSNVLSYMVSARLHYGHQIPTVYMSFVLKISINICSKRVGT